MLDYKNIQIVKGIHNTVRLKNKVTLFFDPFKVDKIPELIEVADIVLITHPHYDHFSPEDILKVLKKDTLVAVGGDIQNEKCSRISDIKNKGRLKSLKPNDFFVEKGIVIRTTYSYNTNKYNKEGSLCHKKDDNFVGFVLDFEGVKIYYAGDTDRIPEMARLREIDIAFLPISGKYVMTSEEAVDVIRVIKPSLVIPLHYGEIVGSRYEGKRFKNLCEKAGYPVRVEILD